MAVARVHVRSCQAAYRTLLPDDYLDQLRPEDRAPSYDFTSRDPVKPRTTVAVEKGLIHGFATTAPSRDPDLADHGELCALYVDPEQWGRGMASPWCRQRAPVCSNSDSEVRFCGSWRVTSVQIAFIKGMGGHAMA
jgi:hypothetical protein